ncbi:MAG: beta-galactosidase, partial [Candidatus Latescibacteria bacterium]|nr:beta-galactosidase [Candidatus Latescibacterota bacterium]
MLKVLFSIKLIFIMMVAILFSANYSSSPNEAPYAEVGMHLSTPAMFVDGNPAAAMCYTTFRGNRHDKYFKDFGKAGVRFVSFHVSPTTLPIWKGPDEFDFSSMDEIMNKIVANNPNALIFPRVNLFSPLWWNEQNPDEVMRFDDGATMKPMDRTGNMELPSWASEKWRNDAAQCIRRMIAHIKSQPYGDRVVGYHLASGGTSEWYYYSNFVWFFQEPLEYYLDYSKPQTEAFRRWLTKKYGTDKALQAAWHNNSVTLKTAEIASKRDKEETDHFIFFDPAVSQNTI